eukprot:1064075-Pleurochrysis_carterae.AAC.1
MTRLSRASGTSPTSGGRTCATQIAPNARAPVVFKQLLLRAVPARWQSSAVSGTDTRWCGYPTYKPRLTLFPQAGPPNANLPIDL